MAETRRAVKDSVFTFLFSQMEYALQLYQSLHPEDKGVTEADCKIMTLENVLTTGQYNDFGFQVRDRLILLLEAQSTFSKNVVLRIFLYLAQTYKQYVEEHKLNLYGSAPVTIPRPELYVVYTGTRTDIPKKLRLSDLYEGMGSVELEVEILRGNGTRDILDQYVCFCHIADECRKQYGRTSKAIQEIFRRCREENILVPFLMSREKEVNSIMETLFSYEKILEIHDYHVAKQAEEKGLEEGRQEGRQEGREEGKELTLLANLKALMKNLGCTAAQAMDMLSVPAESRSGLLARL